MNKIICFASFFSIFTFAQNPSFRSTSNPYYWKNKSPYAGYWQQDVAYTIKASISDKTDIIDGKEYTLKYYNNSPHVLKELFFHLNENAFQPDSYYDNLWKNNKLKPKFSKYEQQKLGTTTENWKVNNQSVTTELDNTILKVNLNAPLQPGDSVVVTCSFKTYFDTGSMRRRNKTFNTFGYKHYDGVHWYPIVCVYDQKFGWHTDQHLDKEFYANFGSFDVELTFPNDFIVEATGELLNKTEVLPDTLRQKIDLRNFTKKPFNSAPSVVITKDSLRPKTWKYFANNVHNFAFTADPLYRIDELDYNGIKVIALVQEPHCSKWIPSAMFTKQVMEIYSNDFGAYMWPKIIVADAQDGMEYPMLTLDGGTYPQHQGLLAHEVGHMWFYGMVANNETYRASLDEGFTQFLTVWALDKITGKVKPRPGPSKYFEKHTDSIVTRFESLYYPYLADVWSGYDEPLNTHSSGFNGAIRHGGSYRLVYYKTGVMLYNLKYVLGDSMFLGAMKHYVSKWKGAHPYPEDFRNAITEYTQTDLNWFFDQWMETTKNIDYQVLNAKKIQKINDSLNIYKIKFQRNGRMQMPVQFKVLNNANQSFNYNIPNTWYVNTSAGITLPKWYGWDLLQPKYDAVVTISGKLKDVIIDDQLLMADIDRTNNSLREAKKYTFDWRVPTPPLWSKMRTYGRPDLWWNNFEGFQLGYASRSNYFNQNYFNETYFLVATTLAQRHISEADKNQNRWFSYYNNDKFNLSKLWRQMWVYDEFIYASGLLKAGIGLEKLFKKQDLSNPRSLKVYANAYVMYRDRAKDATYLLSPNDWEIGKVNSYINIGITKTYPYTVGEGIFNAEMRTPGAFSDFNYYYFQMSQINTFNFLKFELKTRLFARYGGGYVPKESRLYLGGASPEQLFNLRATRAAGVVPDEWGGYGLKTNHFQQGGDLNIRGFAGYMVPVLINGEIVLQYSGLSGASFCAELDFDKYIPIKPYRFFKYFHIDTYLFNDIGSITYNRNNDFRSQRLSELRVSSGMGSALTINFGNMNIKPIVLRFDMPMFINYAPASEQNTQFRYVVGVNRSF
ncbi:MAG: M1 family metallopeptidase [Bacteroidota bacterium]|nr:M1 family metallopeptidase [Bacteroidota bacterium]